MLNNTSTLRSCQATLTLSFLQGYIAARFLARVKLNMRRREFLRDSSIGLAASSSPLLLSSKLWAGPAEGIQKPKDYKKEPFKRLVILGESTVQGGPWLSNQKERYPDVLVRLINYCQEKNQLTTSTKELATTPSLPAVPGTHNQPNPVLWKGIRRMSSITTPTFSFSLMA